MMKQRKRFSSPYSELRTTLASMAFTQNASVHISEDIYHTRRWWYQQQFFFVDRLTSRAPVVEYTHTHTHTLPPYAQHSFSPSSLSPLLSFPTLSLPPSYLSRVPRSSQHPVPSGSLLKILLGTRGIVKHVGRGNSQHLHNLADLVKLVFTTEEGLSRMHLNQYTPETPHVYCQVIGDPKKNLRWAVETTLNVVKHLQGDGYKSNMAGIRGGGIPPQGMGQCFI